MDFGLRVLPAADDDAALHIAQDSVEQAIRFYDAINATYKMILEAPARWPLYGLTDPRFADLRKRAVTGFQNIWSFIALTWTWWRLSALFMARGICRNCLKRPHESRGYIFL